MRTKEAREHPGWSRAYEQAARELNMPPRGEVGSPQNKERNRIGPRVGARARQILERGELDAHA